MITLEQVIAEQHSLKDLCCDRLLETQEIFLGNAFYGIDFILKKYADLPQTTPLKVSIPHGPNLSNEFVWEAEVNAPLPAIFYSSDHEYQSYAKALTKSNNWKSLIPFASPFLYVVELLKNQPKPSRKGTIFFPSHSTHYITSQMDFELLAEALTNLPSEYQPITVCLYWKDFNLNRHIPFKEKGLSIVSAGHMFDPLFLFRFYHLCSTHKYAAGNELGSHLFYAIKAGCSYFYFDKVSSSFTAENQSLFKRDCPEVSTWIQKEIKITFQAPQPYTTPEQMQVVDYYLGSRYLQSPENLRQQLLQLEAIHNLENRLELFLEIHDADVLQQLREIPSETSENERKLLYNFFSKVWTGTQSVCEIGPFLGGTTRAIALGMIANSQLQPDHKLYTFDQFAGYYTGEELAQYLEPSFQTGLVDERLRQPVLNSGSFLEVFQHLHLNKNYSNLLVVFNQSLPQAKELDTKNPFELPAGVKFNAVFIDGCKSWYSTKYFMSKICEVTQPGTYFLFQDYGWYTCFWIPAFLQLFKNYFKPINSVDSTHIFQLIQPLTSQVIEQLCPDDPRSNAAMSKVQIDEIFTQLITAAQSKSKIYTALIYTIQHSAALSYIGFIDEAKLKLSSLFTQTWAKDCLQIIQAALNSPTYLPDGQPIYLFSNPEIQQLLFQAQYFNQYQAQINQLEDRVQSLQVELQTAATIQAELNAKADEMQKQVNRLRRRIKQTKLHLQEANTKIAVMETSKFWKIRNLWFHMKQTLGLKA